MKIYLASDHAGFALKEGLKPYLVEQGHEIVDCGAKELNQDDDYPDYVTPCAERVAADSGSVGIIFGASGQGEAMAANRVKGIRAGVFYGSAGTPQTDASGNQLGMIESLRSHNDANVLSLGARFISEDEAKEAVTAFLSTAFSPDPRHARRISKF